MVAVDAPNKHAIFKHLDEGKQVAVPFELLHVTPPQSAPDVVKQSPLANADGYVFAPNVSTVEEMVDMIRTMTVNSSERLIRANHALSTSGLSTTPRKMVAPPANPTTPLTPSDRRKIQDR